MPELANPHPGWTPPIINGDLGECMRQAFACAAGVHPIRVNYIDADDYSINFWSAWEDEFRRHGFRFQRATRVEAERCGLYWIAIVPSFKNPVPNTHAVVMKGSKLHFDCAPAARRRQRAPRKLCANPIIPVRYGD